MTGLCVPSIRKQDDKLSRNKCSDLLRHMVERTLPSLGHRRYSSTGGDPPGKFVDRKRRIVAAPGHTHLSLRMHILSVDYRLILSAETGFSLTHPQCGRRWTPCL